MVACALDMVMAGTETTSATLQWAALLMGKHPSVQGEPRAPHARPRPGWPLVPSGWGPPGPRGWRIPGTLAPTLSPAGRVQEELDRVLGPERLPRLEDQRSLPYTNAVLHEVQRFITLLPHVARCTAADTQLCGYQLPKVGGPGLGCALGPSWTLMMPRGPCGGQQRGLRNRRGADLGLTAPCSLVLPLAMWLVGHLASLVPLGASPVTWGSRWPQHVCRSRTLEQTSSWWAEGPPPSCLPGGLSQCSPCTLPTGHARGPPAELCAPRQDAVGDAPPVQPWPLPGRRRALCEASGLLAFLCRYPWACPPGPRWLGACGDPHAPSPGPPFLSPQS